MDARAKLVILMAYSLGIFFVDTWWGMAIYASACLVALVACHVEPARVALSSIPIAVLAAFALVAHVIAGGAAGLSWGLFLGVRMLLLAWASFAVCFSTSSAELLEAFEWFLAPLRHTGLHVDDAALTLALSIRFIPLIALEFQQIRRAQTARGGEASTVGFGHALRVYGASFAALFVGLFRKADRLADALSCRCYGAVNRRSNLSKPVFGTRDVVLLVAGVTFCTLVAVAL